MNKWRGEGGRHMENLLSDDLLTLIDVFVRLVYRGSCPPSSSVLDM
jgi:hypothetical protein